MRKKLMFGLKRRLLCSAMLGVVLAVTMGSELRADPSGIPGVTSVVYPYQGYRPFYGYPNVYRAYPGYPVYNYPVYPYYPRYRVTPYPYVYPYVAPYPYVTPYPYAYPYATPGGYPYAPGAYPRY